jgi:ABC-2 type transport system permease protein
MRLWYVLVKSMREMRRDWLTLGLTLVFAPFFVLLYWVFTHGGSTTYTILVLNQDSGAQRASGESFQAGEQVVRAIGAITYADGKPLLVVKRVGNDAEMTRLLRDRAATAFVLIPEDFSRTILAVQSGDHSAHSRVTFGGDLTNPYYVLGAILATKAVDGYVAQATGLQPQIEYVEQPLGASAARTEFENYVPGILILAVILLIFQAAMAVAREVEAGTLRRLQVTPLTAFDYLGGVTVALMIVGVAGLILTFATSLALGFHSQGPVWVAILVGAITSLSVIGVGLITACFSRSVSQAFVIANFPLAFFMFFTGAIFPIPAVTLFTIAGRPLNLYELLPPTHAVVALNKILVLGAGVREVSYELCALTVLSVVYFAIGVWLFNRMHLHRG